MKEKENAFSDFVKRLMQVTDFKKEDLALIKKYSTLKDIKKNTVLVNAGEVSHELFYIYKGCLRTFYRTPDGNEITRCIALEKSYCWTIPGFVTGQPSTETIEALADSQLVCFERSKFVMLNEKNKNFARAYHIELEKLCISYAQRVESFITLNATERYRHLLQRNPRMIQAIPNKIISTYLGITQESLSRIKAKK